MSEDRELIERSARGDGAALGALFRRHHVSVYRYLSRLATTDPSALDDLVQQTFLELARSASRVDGSVSVRAWLFGIAANVARHYARSEVRRKRALAGVSELMTDTALFETPERDAERRELTLRIAKCVSELPEHLREVFVACEVEQLPGTEVARSLGIPEGTLWRRLHESRKLLLGKLGPLT